MDDAAAAVSELQERRAGGCGSPRLRTSDIRLLAPESRRASRPGIRRYRSRFRSHSGSSISCTRGFDLALRVGTLADNRLVARALGLVRAGIFAAPRYLKRTRPAALGRRHRRPRSCSSAACRVGRTGSSSARRGGKGRGPGRGRRGRQRVRPRGGRGRAGADAAPDPRVFRAPEGRPPARAPGVCDRRGPAAARLSDRALSAEARRASTDHLVNGCRRC